MAKTDTDIPARALLSLWADEVDDRAMLLSTVLPFLADEGGNSHIEDLHATALVLLKDTVEKLERLSDSARTMAGLDWSEAADTSRAGRSDHHG